MEPKINYTLVGLFVIGLFSAMIMIGLWLTAGLSAKTYKVYQVNMNESVAGLNVDSPVQYNGVNVGKVKSMQLNPRNPEQVILLLNIQQDTPITTSTTATLMSQGLTGIAYIGLRGGKTSYVKPLTTEPGEPYPIIKTSPSLFTRLDTAVTELTDNLNNITGDLHAVLDANNRAAFKQTLSNLDTLTTNLAANSKQLNASLTSVNVFLKNTAKASQQFPGLIQNGQATMQTLNGQTLPAVNQILSTLNEASNNLLTLSNHIKDNPSLLLRGEAPPPPGPGEQ